MKKGWEYKKLGEVAFFSRGLTYSKKDEVVFSDNIVLRSNNVDLVSGQIIFDELKYLSNDFCIPNEKKVKKGSLLMCMSNGSKIHLGKVALVKEDYGYAFGGFMSLVTPFKDIDSKFFYYTLITPTYKQYIKSLSEGANINNLKIKDLENFVIPIPPLSEQKEIVEYLDSSFAKIDKLKENAAKNLEEAKALFQSALKDALEPKEGWEEKKLKELTNKISDGSHNPPTGLSYSEYRMLSSKNVRNDNFSFDNPRYLSEDDFQKENKRTQLEKGDVLLTIVGAGLGDCCVYDFDDVIVFQRSISVLKPNYDKITSRFLMYSMQFRYDDIRKKSNGAAQKGIYLKQLAAYSLKLPSIKEQQSIVSFLDSLNEKVNTLQQNYSRICDECDALKQAILRQVFE